MRLIEKTNNKNRIGNAFIIIEFVMGKYNEIFVIEIDYFCDMNIVERYKKEIKKLCLQHQVEQMFVFGSVLTKHFNKNSDIDFLVKFGEVDPYDYFENLLDLKENLEKTLNRNVDILEFQALKNPYLKKSIDNNKLLIYGREAPEMAL